MQFLLEERKEEIRLVPMTKPLHRYKQQKFKKHNDNTKFPPKTSITQQMRTDLGRPAGVTTAAKLMKNNYNTLHHRISSIVKAVEPAENIWISISPFILM